MASLMYPELIDAMRSERASLLRLLDRIDAADWTRPTECPAWTVHGIALHLLGDDVSLLSRQRDATPSGLFGYAASHPGLGFLELLHGFNEQWVAAGFFLSSRVLIELLRVTGELTADFYVATDPESLGEPVWALGPTPAPYWLIASREFGERWVHHHQIARAVSASGPDDVALTTAAVDVMMPVFASRFAALPCDVGATIALRVGGIGAWTLLRDESGWSAMSEVPGRPTAELVVPGAAVARLFSRGMNMDDVIEGISTEGDSTLADAARRAAAEFLGRPA